MNRRHRYLVLSILLVLCACSPCLFAHPHVFIETSLTFAFDAQGLMEIQCEWCHDPYTSSDLVSHYDKNGDKKLSEAESCALADGLLRDIRTSLYFSHIRVDGEEFEIGRATEPKASVSNKRLWLWFSIPCAVEATDQWRQVRIAQYDAEYYVAFEPGMLGHSLAGAEAIECRVERIKSPVETEYGVTIEPRWLVLKFRRKGATDEAQVAGGSASDTAFSGAKEPRNDGAAASGEDKPVVSRRSSGFLERIAAAQRSLQDRMAELLEVDDTGGIRLSALALLCVFAFAYGVLHAAGPGHGKVITASWLAGDKRRLASGILLGGLLALFHGTSGVAVVLIGRIAMAKTAMATMGSVERPMKAVSFGLIAALGASMLIAEILAAFRRRAQTNRAEAGPLEPDTPKRDQLVLLALAAGIVPCPGVVLVMLFCAALGHTLVGLLLAGCVTLGMALTIALVGVLTVVLRRAGTGLSERRGLDLAIVERGLRILGAGGVFVLGVAFLLAALRG